MSITTTAQPFRFEYYGSGRSNIPVGARISAFVRSGGPTIADDSFVKARLYTTLNAALATAYAGIENYVIVLPGHAENISSADQMSSLIAGTKIVGVGAGSNRPTFTWTAATATFLFDVANTLLTNCHLIVATSGNAGVSVAAPITVSAAHCEISDCLITAPGDANDLATIGITTTAAADYFKFNRNVCIGATAAESTTFLRIVGGAGLQIHDNFISWATSAVAVGSVQALTTAPTNISIMRNYIANNKAASEEALTLVASITGTMDWNNLAVLDNASVAMDTVGNITMGDNNYLANTVGERGLRLGTVSA